MRYFLQICSIRSGSHVRNTIWASANGDYISHFEIPVRFSPHWPIMLKPMLDKKKHDLEKTGILINIFFGFQSLETQTWIFIPTCFQHIDEAYSSMLLNIYIKFRP
jgi:hypothetical protein